MDSSPQALLDDALSRGKCLKLVISQPRRGIQTEFTKVVVQPVEVRRQPAWQFAFHASRKVTHENLDARSAIARVSQLLAETFLQAALYTPEADYAIRARPDGALQVSSSPPSRAPATAVSHNREKSYLIPEGTPCPFLAEIGVMTPEGQVRRSMYHKFRQINRFLELVNDVIPALSGEGALRVVDFGCGKSYLTFAVHHLLTEIHRREVEIVGLDRQPDVIRTCSDLAQRLGCAGLSFEIGEIATYRPPAAVDLVVSLHACDTATDLAIAQGVHWGSSAILAVPCCQHELAPQIQSDELSPLLKFGILRERFAAMTTDALRAALLEIHGYSTQVLEFIDMEHTPKNLLIRAVKRRQEDPSKREVWRTEYSRLITSLGIKSFALERALAPSSERRG